MLFRKYQFVIFKERHGSCSKVCIPGWTFLLAGVLFIALIGTNIFFWDYYRNFKSVSQQLEQAEKKGQSQNIQLTSFYHKIKELEQDLDRVREFDDRLRVMLNIDPEHPASSFPAGGTPENSLSNSYPFYRQEMLARKMHSFIEQLSTQARLEEIRQQEIIQAIKNQNDLLSSTPSIWPTQGWVSSEFGYRNSPFTGRREFHRGLDISAPIGTPIYAPADGKVSFSGNDGAYGISLVINHGRGITTRYAHLQRYVAQRNQEVSRGQLIGYVGNTGRSTGPHLHYEVRVNNMPVNPMRYILN
ncbi:M23 family metallopeptidase [Desulfonatronovibrio hydrogenovorans]|uniref:M23 family metallopeptidase n=1 Tax=Desulfonatronovibrio hydrogenovorans TaxID=53245 RepID=UPI00048B655E|nr:M23 family metallopeptidase [Desulfonatronovibrio hydrogenovorans]